MNFFITYSVGKVCSPFGGIPRNWKLFKKQPKLQRVLYSSPFGGIPRNWKLVEPKPLVIKQIGKFPLRGDP